MHSARMVRTALALADSGANAAQISRQLGLPRSTVRDWIAGSVPHESAGYDGSGACDKHAFTELHEVYVYLLGLYLGDGCISVHRRGVYRLRIALDVKYPEIIDCAASAMSEVCPGRALLQLRPQNYVEVSSYWKCWPCLLPQFGPGRKPNRPIVLTDWQQALVDRWPAQILRGLVHSDGCRFQNTGRGKWSWPRYSFRNRSADIRDIFCRACDSLQLRWTAAAPNTIYVSRKADVAALDAFIGPKR
jgi:Homeodomain-like domain